MQYRVAKFSIGVLRTSVILYTIVGVLMFSQVLLGGIFLGGGLAADSFFGKLLWNAAYYSWILFVIELLLLLYAAYAVIDVNAVIGRLRTVSLHIEDGKVFGTSLPRPHSWKRGQEFSVLASEILSIGVLEVKLHGRSAANSLCINTKDGSYILPAIDDVAGARKQLESARSTAQKADNAKAKA